MTFTLWIPCQIFYFNSYASCLSFRSQFRQKYNNQTKGGNRNNPVWHETLSLALLTCSCSVYHISLSSRIIFHAAPLTNYIRISFPSVDVQSAKFKLCPPTYPERPMHFARDNAARWSTICKVVHLLLRVYPHFYQTTIKIFHLLKFINVLEGWTIKYCDKATFLFLFFLSNIFSSLSLFPPVNS